MATFRSLYANKQMNVPEPFGSEVQSIRATIATTTALALNDILYMMDLPVDAVPLDCVLYATDLDTGGSPAITLSVGVLNDGATDLDTSADNGGAAWIVASTIGQAGGMARPTTNALWRSVARKNTISGGTPTGGQLTKIGVKVAAGAATAAAGTVGLELFYRAKVAGE